MSIGTERAQGFLCLCMNYSWSLSTLLIYNCLQVFKQILNTVMFQIFFLLHTFLGCLHVCDFTILNDQNYKNNSWPAFSYLIKTLILLNVEFIYSIFTMFNFTDSEQNEAHGRQLWRWPSEDCSWPGKSQTLSRSGNYKLHDSFILTDRLISILSVIRQLQSRPLSERNLTFPVYTFVHTNQVFLSNAAIGSHYG